MLAVRCAVFDFSFCPFVLSILPSDGAIGTIDSGGVIEIFNFSSAALLPLVTSSCSLCGPHSPADGSLNRLPLIPVLAPLSHRACCLGGRY